MTRAHILLKSDSSPNGPKWKYEQICAAYNITPLTVMTVRKSFVEKGLEATYAAKSQIGSTNMRWMVKRKRI
jgi:hypothetical protein